MNRCLLALAMAFFFVPLPALAAERPAPEPATPQPVNLMPLESRLLANGFVRLESSDAVRTYEKSGITRPALLAVLALQSPPDFKPTPSAPPDAWILQAHLPGYAICRIVAPMPLVGAPPEPPDSTVFRASVSFYPSDARASVIRPGMLMSDVSDALEWVAAERVSITSAGPSYSYYWYVLPDGTCARLSSDGFMKSGSKLLSISIGPKGERYQSDAERDADFQSGLFRKTDSLDLSQYAHPPAP